MQTLDNLSVWVTLDSVLLVNEMEMQVADSVFLVITVLTHDQARRGTRKLPAFDPSPYLEDLEKQQQREILKALQILRRVPFSEQSRTKYTQIWTAILEGAGSVAEVCYLVQAAPSTVQNIVHQMEDEGLITVNLDSYPHFEVCSG